MLRRAAFLAALVAVAAGCGGGKSAGHGDCAALLVWNGVTYEGAAVEEPPALGTRLGEALVPECEPEPERSVEVAQIEGIHPSIALVARGPDGTYPDRGVVWLGPGYLATSPIHPLHEEIRVALGFSDAETGYDCAPARAVRVRARARPAASQGFLEVTADDERLQAFLERDGVAGIVTLDADTTVVGFRRHGVPFIDRGDEFELTLRECVGKKDEPGLAGLRRLVAERLEP